MMVDKVIRDDKVAVLISYNIGTGWSTWNRDCNQEFMLMDAKLIKLYEQNASEIDIEEYIISALKLRKTQYVTMYGWKDVSIVWVPIGTQFYISEYNGAETLLCGYVRENITA